MTATPKPLSSNTPLYPVILSGGSGTRLWPLSQPERPKQFLSLDGDGPQSLFQNTLLRLKGLTGLQAPVILSSADFRLLVSEQLAEIHCRPLACILEPVGRNTAPAIAFAAMRLLEASPNAVMLVLPSDHLIEDAKAFRQMIIEAMPLAESGELVTFGIVPNRTGDQSRTGYGYIEQGEPLNAEQGESLDVKEASAYRVQRFIEKPPLEQARTYSDSGRFYWNSGMFLMRAQTLLDELAITHPAMLAACRRVWQMTRCEASGNSGGDTYGLDLPSLMACPAQSLDYVVMEHTQRAVVVPANIGWQDVGTWQSLWELGEKDAAGNVVTAPQGMTVQLSDAEHCLIHCQGMAQPASRARSSRRRTIAAVGVSNLLIVDTGETLLIGHRDSEHQIKALVESLQSMQSVQDANNANNPPTTTLGVTGATGAAGIHPPSASGLAATTPSGT